MRFHASDRMDTVRAAVGPTRILIVEDDAAIRETLAEVLAGEGFAVSCASNGAEALDRLALETAPNVILLDLMMPVMDGWAFRDVQRLDPRLSGIPVLVLSASHGDDRAAIDALGAAAFLAKPYDLDDLIDTVHRLC